MKEFVQRKQGPLYVVSPPRSSGDVFDFTPIALDHSFENWLNAVEASESELNLAGTVVSERRASEGSSRRGALQLCTPAIAQSLRGDYETNGLSEETARPANSENCETDSVPARTALTTQDYIRVMLATIRESCRHVSWPTEVIARFLASDVITRSVSKTDNKAS